jgi:hypothetical protein
MYVVYATKPGFNDGVGSSKVVYKQLTFLIAALTGIRSYDNPGSSNELLYG